MSLESTATFFVNSGLVSSRTDIHNLLRPLLRQTVGYRYYRAGVLVAHGTGWVERIVSDHPEISTFFTPLSICLNVDSFEHLEFETRPDQLLIYTLVQGDKRVVVEYAPYQGGEAGVQQAFRFQPDGFVQMELSGLDQGEAGGSGSEGGAPAGS
ncbi:MAG: hypothetical protein ACXWQ6_08055 [Candidatus Limnocylindrales bacterium]